jgi:hypothetical protein
VTRRDLFRLTFGAICVPVLAPRVESTPVRAPRVFVVANDTELCQAIRDCDFGDTITFSHPFPSKIVTLADR